MSEHQPGLFDWPPVSTPGLPQGLRFAPELVTTSQERGLIDWAQTLDFKPFEFRGYVGARRVISFGWRYDFARRALDGAEPIPEALLPLRLQVADFTGHAPEAFQQALVLEYRPGAGIGWHRDRPEFGEVAGVSLGSPCPLRLRRKTAAGWDRSSLIATPRSAYLLSGSVRDQWEHSIAPVRALRYAITFRTLR